MIVYSVAQAPTLLDVTALLKAAPKLQGRLGQVLLSGKVHAICIHACLIMNDFELQVCSKL